MFHGLESFRVLRPQHPAIQFECSFQLLASLPSQAQIDVGLTDSVADGGLHLRLAGKFSGDPRRVSVAARNGAILAGWKGPPVWLRNGLWGVTRSPAFRFGLPYGNSGCPSATAPFSPRAAGVLYDLRSACLCQQKSLSGLLGLAESGEYSLSQTKSASLFPARMGLPAVNHIAARARLCDRASGWAPLTAIERWRCGPPGPAKVAPSPAATNTRCDPKSRDWGSTEQGNAVKVANISILDRPLRVRSNDLTQLPGASR